MPPSSYHVPACEIETELEVKKSRFIARANYAESRESAMAFLDQARKDYPDARHHCWAYLIGSPAQPVTMAMSDDGEPSGTAGKPMLNVLQHKDVGDIMVVIIRYFGGIKLGAGGLVRAYSAATQQAIDELETKERRMLAKATVTCDFSVEQSLRHWLTQHGGHVESVDYQQRVSLLVATEQNDVVELQAWCAANNAVFGSEDV